MKVCLYRGSLALVAKSGVGQAVLHQTAMLESQGIQITGKIEADSSFVHINTVLPDSFFAALYAKLLRKKVIYYGHSTMEDFRNSFKGSNFLAPLFRSWIKLCYSMGDAVITPTEYSKGLLASYGIKKPIYALSNGIDTAYFSFDSSRRTTFRKQYGLTDIDKAVISVGHYIERKGILDFIELARSMPQCKFFWFGYTDLRLVPQKIQQAIQSAPANLAFPGYIDREELRNAYCGCDLFCFMSHEETEGIVVLEALACCTPTIIRDIPVYKDWLTDSENVYKAQDNTRFLQIASALLQDQLPLLAKNERRTAEERSIPAIGRKLLTIYRDISASETTANRVCS